VDLFSGTVENYRRYRSGVPAEVVTLGTGTGFVVEALKNDFAEIAAYATDGALRDDNEFSVLIARRATGLDL
jgi:hypothetical protein